MNELFLGRRAPSPPKKEEPVKPDIVEKET